MRAEAKDLLLPAGIVAVVGIMIFPMPSIVLDSLLMCNISFALLLLISAVYLSEPQKFTSLPTILLLSTLFRLGLNIATTRQILSGDSVPSIILTFGSFVVGGNVVVGLVIFVIITLVQFLVIAKGSERVAEVAARFALDAMPGKQMSIDADIRSGMLSVAEARERRRELQVESKLFGALDGAMKFVKGDAIAGILITAINITAGFIVGVTQQNLGLLEAVERFTIFTIGDGLVSQIPALLVAVAAGVVVTRVADGGNEFVGRDMLSQLTREPQALVASAIVLLMLAAVPGLPAIPFLAMATLLFVMARGVREEQRTKQRVDTEEVFRPRAASRIVLQLSAQAASRLRKEQSLIVRIAQYRRKEFQERGVIVPEIEFEILSSIQGQWFAVALQGVVSREVHFEEEQLMLGEVIIEVLREEVRLHLASLLDDTHTRKLLELHLSSCEDLINAVVPEQIGVTQLTRLLRSLVRDRVRIREMPAILQAIAEDRLASSTHVGEPMLGSEDAEHLLERAVRIALRRSITQDLQNHGVIETFVLGEHFESRALGSLHEIGSIAPEILSDVVACALARPELKILLVSPRLRPHVGALLSGEVQGLRVISPEEILPDVELKVVGDLEDALGKERQEAA